MIAARTLVDTKPTPGRRSKRKIRCGLTGSRKPSTRLWQRKAGHPWKRAAMAPYWRRRWQNITALSTPTTTASGAAGGGGGVWGGGGDSAGEVDSAIQPQTSNTTRSARLLSICSIRRPRNSSGGDRPATRFRTSPTKTSETSTKVYRRCSITSLRARANKKPSQRSMKEKLIMKSLQQGMALFVSFCLLLMGIRDGFAYQADPLLSPSPPQAAQESPEQLQQLVAPIALYPDALIAQILAAATYPDQIVKAEEWMGKHKHLEGEKLAKEVNKEHWDPGVKALTQFPAVLANMNQNLAWTSELGDASINQQQALNQAIQTMRQRAQRAGNLKTTAQETVSNNNKTIVIQPAAPDVVYVPQYDPWLVYGDPLAVFPDWYPYPGLFWDGPGVYWGLGFGVGLFDEFGWGWNGWGYDWRGGRGVYNHRPYISHSRSIVNRGSFRPNREDFGRSTASRTFEGTRSSAFSGFNHGEFARSSSFRGQSSFGGFHGGGFGGFRGGGFGGGFHGGGGRR